VLREKPWSDGSRVYFGYEGKALVVSGPELLLEDQRSF